MDNSLFIKLTTSSNFIKDSIWYIYEQNWEIAVTTAYLAYKFTIHKSYPFLFAILIEKRRKKEEEEEEVKKQGTFRYF